MRKTSLIVIIIIGLSLTGCNNEEDALINEDNEPTIVYPSRITSTLREVANEAEIIANLTITELVNVIEVEHDEYTIHEHSIYKAKVNYYLHNELDYDHEIEVLQAGGPNWRFGDDPLLEVGETYILFLDNREDPNLGTNLVMTGGPTGRYNKVDDVFVRQLNPSNDKGLNQLTEGELIEALNKRNEELNIDLAIIE